MSTIELQISEDLAQRLAPYRDQLPALLEAGLRTWEQDVDATNDRTVHERIRRVLAASGRVRLSKSYRGAKPYVRHTPVPITGQPVSEIVIEQRGDR